MPRSREFRIGDWNEATDPRGYGGDRRAFVGRDTEKRRPFGGETRNPAAASKSCSYDRNGWAFEKIADGGRRCSQDGVSEFDHAGLSSPSDGWKERAGGVAAPKGCKIGKGFGFSRAEHDGGFRASQGAGGDNYPARTTNPYVRSKSNTDADSIGHFQNWKNRTVSSIGDTKRDAFARPRANGVTAQFDGGRRAFHQDDRARENWRRCNGSQAGDEDYWAKEEDAGGAAASSRFTIVKASRLFGPIESTEPDVTNGEGSRRFFVAKASDVFRLNSSDDSEGGASGRRWSHYERRGRDREARIERRPSGRSFNIKHPDEVFSANGSRRGSTADERAAKAHLPWPYNKFAENPGLRQTREENRRREAATSLVGTTEVAEDTRSKGRSDEEGGDDEDGETECRRFGSIDRESNAETFSSSGSRPPSYRSAGSGSGNEIEVATPTPVAATKPKVLSIYEQYEQFGLDDDDDLNFLAPTEKFTPVCTAVGSSRSGSSRSSVVQ